MHAHSAQLLAHFFATAMVDAMAFVVPRLKKSYHADIVNQEIRRSVMGLVSDLPTSEQFEAIKMFLSGKDVFVSLPTGSGKSVCFTCLPQVLASYFMWHGKQCLL